MKRIDSMKRTGDENTRLRIRCPGPGLVRRSSASGRPQGRAASSIRARMSPDCGMPVPRTATHVNPALVLAAFLALNLALTLVSGSFCTALAQAGSNLGLGFTGSNGDTVAMDPGLAAAAAAAADTAQAGGEGADEDSLAIAKTPTQRMIDSLKALGEAGEEVPSVTLTPVSYSTNYTLNRTTSNWTQSLSFGFSARGVSVSTQTSGNLYADTETKSDRRNGTSQVTIDYAPTDRLSVGLDFNLSRHTDKFLNKQYDSDQVGARASYLWEQSENFSTRITATAGSIGETKPTYTGSGTTSMLMLDTKYVFPVPCTLKVNGSSQMSNKRSEDLATALETQDQDLNESLKATLGFTPLKNTTMRIGYSKSDKRLQYPFLGKQETWDSKGTVVDASLGVNFMSTGSVSTEARYSDTQIDYAVERSRSNSYLSKTLTTSVKAPDFAGITFTSRMGLENASSVTGTGRNGDTKTKTLSGKLERRLTPLIAADALGNISITQYYFYDAPSISDERDIYKDAVSLGLRLGRAGGRVGGYASVKRDLQKMLYIRSKNSGNNRTNELYSATASVFYKRGAVSFTQAGSMTSDYTLFHFSEDQNILSRTTSISSSIDFPFGAKSTFRLSHVYRVQDSGSYIVPEGGGAEVYTRSGGSVTEELYLRASHNVTPDVSLTVGQRYQQTRSFRFLGGRKKWTVGGKVLELLSDFSAKYQLDPLSSVNFTASRTYSAYAKSYWNIAASFSRQFF